MVSRLPLALLLCAVFGATSADALNAAEPVAAGKPAREDYTAPITVRGRATAAGRPLAGAVIYLAATQPGYARVAETKTDAEGRYEFVDVPLPIEANDGAPDRGGFEVFGRADGYGFAWRPSKWFYPGRKSNLVGRAGDDLPRTFEAGEAIELELKFPPPAALRGRLVDELGRPIPDAKVSIQYCDPIWDKEDYNGKSTQVGFSALNDPRSVPDEMKVRRSNADGRFVFDALPPHCRFSLAVRAPGYPRRSLWAVTQEGVSRDAVGTPIYSGDFELVLSLPREVAIQVVLSDHKLPAAGVRVIAGRLAEGVDFGVTDADGRVTLRLPAGDCKVTLLPARGTPYLTTERTVQVPASPLGTLVAAAAEVSLRPAAVAEVTVLDADTGTGVAGVDLWIETPQVLSSAGNAQREVYYFRRYDAATSTDGERPQTGEDGTMKAMFEPGRHRIGVGLQTLPAGYVPLKRDGQEVDLQTGEATRLTFRVWKRR
jgi:protocatechuate 3,4-dioxygenase beta subunit